jgi:hypothetical protein
MALVNAITRGLDFGPWKFKKAVQFLYFDEKQIGPDT